MSNGASFDNRSSKEQHSSSQTIELLRNVHHRVGIDGSTDYNLLQYIQGIAATLASAMKREASRTNVVSAADANAHLLIHGYPGMRIYVFDILLSINAPSEIHLEDAEGNNLLATMYAPNAGQGYTMNSFRGKPLLANKSLYVRSTNAVSYSIDCAYCLIE